jgi:hypothetical protein
VITLEESQTLTTTIFNPCLTMIKHYCHFYVAFFGAGIQT